MSVNMIGLPLTGKVVFGSYLRDFWVMQDVYGEGFAYLALIEPQYRSMVKTICRSYPTLQSICALDSFLFSTRMWDELFIVHRQGKLQFCEDARQGALSWASMMQAKHAFDGIIPAGWMRLLDRAPCVDHIEHCFTSPLSGVLSMDADLAVKAESKLPDQIVVRHEEVQLQVSSTIASESQNRYYVEARVEFVEAERWYQVRVPDLQSTIVQLLVPKALEMRDASSRRLVGLADVHVGDLLSFKTRLPVPGFMLMFQWDMHDGFPRWSDAGTAHLFERKGHIMEFGDGYCYLTLIRPGERVRVSQALGSYPALGQLVSLPVDNFLPDLSTVAYSMFHGRMHLYRQLDAQCKFLDVCAVVMAGAVVCDGTLGATFPSIDRYQCDLGVDLNTRVGGFADVGARQSVGQAVGSAVQGVESSTVVEKATTMSLSTVIAMVEGILLFVILVIFVFNKCVSGKGKGSRGGGYGYR